MLYLHLRKSARTACELQTLSLILVVGKLLEGILIDGISQGLERQGLARESQLSFVCGKVSVTNLIEFFLIVIKKFDKGNIVDVVYMDLSNALDNVPHVRLAWKVRSYDILDNLTNWKHISLVLRVREWWWKVVTQIGCCVNKQYNAKSVFKSNNDTVVVSQINNNDGTKYRKEFGNLVS